MVAIIGSELAEIFRYYVKRKGGYNMPVHRVKGGYKYGTVGKVYKSRAKAVAQGRAIKISQLKKGKKAK